MFAHKLIFIINNFFFFLLKFLCDILDVRNPFRGRAKLGDEETSYFGILKGSKYHTTVGNDCTHIDAIFGLNTGKEMPLAVCNFYLLFIAENYIFIVVVQKVNGVDRLVVRRPES